VVDVLMILAFVIGILVCLWLINRALKSKEDWTSATPLHVIVIIASETQLGVGRSEPVCHHPRTSWQAGEIVRCHTSLWWRPPSTS
jgi:hypothetical protein